MTSNLPLTGSWNFNYEIEGQPQPDARRRPSVDAIITTPDYFRVMGDPFIAGRDFTPADGTSSALNIIVNRQCAETFWHGENAIGKRLRFYKKDVAQPWLTVVGIVPNIASAINRSVQTRRHRLSSLTASKPIPACSSPPEPRSLPRP